MPVVREGLLEMYCEYAPPPSAAAAEGSGRAEKKEAAFRAWAEGYAKHLRQLRGTTYQSPRVKALSDLGMLLYTTRNETCARVNAGCVSPSPRELKVYKTKVDAYLEKVKAGCEKCLALEEETEPDDVLKDAIAQIYADVVAADAEFGGVEIKGRVAGVTFGPIEFGELKLGRFHVTFDYTSVCSDGGHILSAKPLDPNYAWNSSRDISHPHVQARAICMGEGLNSVSRAFKDGRYLDAMTVVREVLHTYSPASPFRHLDRWTEAQNRLCYDCGVQLPSGEGEYCCGPGQRVHCRRLMCPTCVKARCHVTGHALCSGHLWECPKCKQHAAPVAPTILYRECAGSYVCKTCCDAGKCCMAHTEEQKKKSDAASGQAPLACGGCEAPVAAAGDLMDGLCAACMTARTLMPERQEYANSPPEDEERDYEDDDDEEDEDEEGWEDEELEDDDIPEA